MNYPSADFSSRHDTNLLPREHRQPIEQWGLKCANPECAEYTADEHQFTKCSVCHALHCGDCLVSFGSGELYCPACTHCDRCGSDRVVGECSECGDLMCATHARHNEYEDRETGYRESSTVCHPRCGARSETKQ